MSKVRLAIVIAANGEPPAGGSKIPLIVNCGRSPPGVSNRNFEPSVRLWSFAKVLSVNAPFVPSVSNVRCEPSFQSIWKMWLAPGSTAESECLAPKARASPKRTPTTSWTPAVFRSWLPIAIGIRSKLFSAVTA